MTLAPCSRSPAAILVVADVALRVAAGRITADADALTRLLLAAHLAVAGESGPRRAAAVVVLAAQAAVRVATRRGLAHRDAAVAVRCAQPAAAAAAAVTHGAVDLARAIRGSGRRLAAGPEARAVANRTARRAALRVARADVAGLGTERGAQAAATLVAQLRAALAVVAALVAGSLAARVQWRARALIAVATAALRADRAATRIRDAARARALPADAAERTALGRAGAGRTHRRALSDAGAAGVSLRVAQPRAAVACPHADGSEGRTARALPAGVPGSAAVGASAASAAISAIPRAAAITPSVMTTGGVVALGSSAVRDVPAVAACVSAIGLPLLRAARRERETHAEQARRSGPHGSPEPQSYEVR